MAQTSQRKRVTPQDFPKREIKLDVVEQKPIPAMPVWYLAPVVLPVVLWIAMPSQGALWLALTATVVWLAVFGMKLAETNREDFGVDREIALTIVNYGTLGIALGTWAYFILQLVGPGA